MSVTIHQRPGVYSSYDASSVVSGSGSGRLVGLAGVNTKATAGEPQTITSYEKAAAAFGSGGDEDMAELIRRRSPQALGVILPGLADEELYGVISGFGRASGYGFDVSPDDHRLALRLRLQRAGNSITKCVRHMRPPLSHVHTAVDVHQQAGDKCRVFTGQNRHSPSHSLRPSQSPQRGRFGQPGKLVRLPHFLRSAPLASALGTFYNTFSPLARQSFARPFSRQTAAAENPSVSSNSGPCPEMTAEWKRGHWSAYSGGKELAQFFVWQRIVAIQLVVK